VRCIKTIFIGFDVMEKQPWRDKENRSERVLSLGVRLENIESFEREQIDRLASIFNPSFIYLFEHSILELVLEISYRPVNLDQVSSELASHRAPAAKACQYKLSIDLLVERAHCESLVCSSVSMCTLALSISLNKQRAPSSILHYFAGS